MITRAMNMAIKAYSIAVAPDSHLLNLARSLVMLCPDIRCPQPSDTDRA
jgi:hypothetical protein